MTASIDKLRKMSFRGISFPYKRRTIKCGLRTHRHEYPHVDGASLEKLGRRPYEIDVQTHFGSTSLNPAWADLWPTQLNELSAIFDSGETAPLYIPGMGELKCVCEDWNRVLDTRLRSGEDVDLKFVEDFNATFDYFTFVRELSTDLPVKLSGLNLALPALEPQPDIFSAIDRVASDIMAIRDQANLAGTMLASKISSLIDLCREADATLEQLRDPVNYEVLEALKALWAAAVELEQDLAGKGTPLKEWRVPALMSVGDISVKIYGTAERGTDIMSLNAIEDAFAVPAGKTVLYYPP